MCTKFGVNQIKIATSRAHTHTHTHTHSLSLTHTHTANLNKYTIYEIYGVSTTIQDMNGRQMILSRDKLLGLWPSEPYLLTPLDSMLHLWLKGYSN